MSSRPGGKKRALLVCCAALFVLGLALGLYAGNYSHADAEAEAALANAQQSDGMYAFGDTGAHTGMIFYPGGKVDPIAYAPLMEAVTAETGALCVVPKMPLNLAVFDRDAADRVRASYPDVKAWYVGGHSLGGAMAASYAAAHDVSGVILLAAYSTQRLTMPVLSIRGSEDTVLEAEKYAAYRANLCGDCTEQTLPGGNHAQFGCYGAQKGDAPASISGAEQRAQTARIIAAWLFDLER